MNVKITRAISEADIAACMHIRRKVFIEGQNIPEEIEIDGNDPECDLFILKLDEEIVGTARIRYFGSKAKIERVAILQKHQGKGFGKKLMEYMMDKICNEGKAEIMALSAQSHAISFYESLGFIVSSEEYMEAGILHKDMQKDVLRSQNE